jgi:putative ABC transport system permease protein
MQTVSARLYNLTEGVRIALDALRANRVRAGLTILGVAVGVFAVVGISAAVHGINVSVERDFASAGPTTFFVSRFPISFEACDDSGETCRWLRNPSLTMGELDAIRRLPDIEQAGARMDWSVAAKVRDKTLKSVGVEAYTGNWGSLSAPDIQPGGRAFTEVEARGAARVAVISTVTAERLFGEGDPLGREVQLNGIPFRIIGVYKDNSSFLSGGTRPKLVMPILTLNRALNVRLWDMGLAVKPRPGVTTAEAVDQVEAVMRGLRRLRPVDPANWAILTQDKLMSTYNQIFGTMFLVMISLSAVGLLVGGVGVVAIMMISVTERTREIGVRKALGATRATILFQFLVEAVTLTGVGAAVGLLGGWAIAALVRSATPIEASIPPLAVLAAVGASVVTGVAFGMVPALRASRLDPVEALRFE